MVVADGGEEKRGLPERKSARINDPIEHTVDTAEGNRPSILPLSAFLYRNIDIRLVTGRNHTDNKLEQLCTHSDPRGWISICHALCMHCMLFLEVSAFCFLKACPSQLVYLVCVGV